MKTRPPWVGVLITSFPGILKGLAELITAFRK
jgi:hypothetical protein